MNSLQRAVILVIDSGGVGALPDAATWGDAGADTLGHVAEAAGGLSLPNLQRLGLGNVHAIRGVPPVAETDGFYARMHERSEGKDTTTGHWEMAGIVTEVPFRTYPHGFPPDLVGAFEQAIGKRILGNKPASGTAIIQELGEEHVRTGCPIVYTSADSVFQIACHEEIWPIEELYRICDVARGLLVGPHSVSRVIARPFVGTPGNFTRTARRHDYSVSPPGQTLLDLVAASGRRVTGVGKIRDIFNGQGVTDHRPSKNNLEGLEATRRDLLEDLRPGLLFTNLVDFDMNFGHRRDPIGYGRALEEMDVHLPQVLEAMREGDLLFITADHGCDPTAPGTDHTREYVPLLVWGPGLGRGGDLGTLTCFGDIAATILEGFGLGQDGLVGTSFASRLRKESTPC